MHVFYMPDRTIAHKNACILYRGCQGVEEEAIFLPHRATGIEIGQTAAEWRHRHGVCPHIYAGPAPLSTVKHDGFVINLLRFLIFLLPRPPGAFWVPWVPLGASCTSTV